MKLRLHRHETASGARIKWWWKICPLLVLLALPRASVGQPVYATPYTISTLAGHPLASGSANGTGSVARFTAPVGVATDLAGNVYVTDGNNLVRMVTPASVVTTLAGRAGNRGTNDGMGSAALFDDPAGLAVDGAGNVYVADYLNDTIRQLKKAGTNWMVTTLAGNPGVSGHVDATGSAAQFNGPIGLALDGAGNIYVGDSGSDTIRKLTPAGTNWSVTTLAGEPNIAGTNDGTGNGAQFNGPEGVAVDGATNIYVADYANNTIRKMTMSGTNWVVTTIAGSPQMSGSNDGPGNVALFFNPALLALDTETNLYTTDAVNQTIRKLTPDGTNCQVTTLAGSPKKIGIANGAGGAAGFDTPIGVAVDTSGNLYVADARNQTIRRGFPAGGAPVILTNGAGPAFGSNQFEFNLTAAAGQSVVVDGSTDLAAWSPLWTNTIGPLSNGVGSSILPFSDPQAGAYSNRFYRARLP